MKRSFLRTTLLGLSATASLTLATTASAQMTVFDPANYAQNLLTAARALQQINNQITALQNQSRMLTNQRLNLQSLSVSSLAQLQSDTQKTQTLLGQAQHIAYDVNAINSAFATQYGTTSLTASDQALVQRAQTRWATSVGGFQDTLKVQAGAVGNLPNTNSEMTRLVTASQGAVGALQAAQAGNQLLALVAKELADLIALVAAQGRAQALEGADRISVHGDAQSRFSQFMTTGAGYQPGSVAMFH